MRPPARGRYRAIVAQAGQSGTQEAPATRPARRSSGSLGPLGLRRGVALGRPPRIALALGPQNAAPFLVLGYWHPALDADVDPLARFGVA